MSVQLRLFPLVKPLVERLGHDFFKGAPRSPGVYVMRGLADRILYIGQSKNLRLRLAFYKNANPDRIPRRLVRLVHEVETITWECCGSAIAARARELELLRAHRPRFNRADTGPHFFHYVETDFEENETRLQLHLDPPAVPEQSAWLGPIRGRMIPMQAFAALQRFWFAMSNKISRCAELPLLPKRLTAVTLRQTEFTPALASFLRAESIDLVTQFLAAQNPNSELALRQLQECDAETLLSWARLLQEAE